MQPRQKEPKCNWKRDKCIFQLNTENTLKDSHTNTYTDYLNYSYKCYVLVAIHRY